MDEPPIHYYALEGPKEEAWRTADQWPPAGAEMTRLYLGDGPTGSVDSANDGSLRTGMPGNEGASDRITVDYGTTTGEHARWSAINWERDYSDMRSNDERGLTYTTPPLEADVQVVGHPVAHLWLTTDAPDLDVFVYLEEVDGRGRSTYITEGVLRASHRAQSQAPYENLGLPFHRHYESELAPVPAWEPVELVFDLLPTAYRFREGNRVRMTVAFADAGNFETSPLNPPPEVRVLRETDHLSSVDLPIQGSGPVGLWGP
jgi:putative CocE/NonD family hydrolase